MKKVGEGPSVIYISERSVHANVENVTHFVRCQHEQF